MSESERARATRARVSRVGLSAKSIEAFVTRVVADDLHAKTVMSVANATLGVLHAASLCIHVIGRAYAYMTGNDGKHGVKQIDRLLSNEKVSPWALAGSWIAMVVGPRKDLLIALDWTDFDKDDHTTLVASLLTRHGRATALLWKTVRKSELLGQRSAHEDRLLEHLKASLPEGVRATIVADRGFGDQHRYAHLTQLGLEYIIRFREGILVTDQYGVQKPGTEWIAKNGRATKLESMAVTADCHVVPALVLVHDKRMADAWCLATSRADLSASEVVKYYGKRFTIEETFRDTKNGHLGMGLSSTHIKNEDRRDRLMFIAALAHMLLTLLGAAAESCGLDRTLKTNTSAKRQLSLYNQGLHWYMAIPNMREARLEMLVAAYGAILMEHQFTRELFAVV